VGASLSKIGQEQVPSDCYDEDMNQSRITTYTTLVSRTLWRIETDLAHALSLHDLAAAEGVSSFHLSRAFSLITGQPIMGYVRARRLSEAAHRLNSGEDSVLNIALDAGYESPEGFSRAFRKVFGVAPKVARDVLPNQLQEPIVMEPQKIDLPDAKIIDFAGRTLIGRSSRFSMAERSKIPAFWQRTAEEIGPRMYGTETFGVSFDFEEEAFRYMVAIESDGDAEGLERKSLPAGRYAVFEHAGHISGIPNTWNAIFEQWMPSSGEEIADGPEFEQYEKDFDPEGENGASIWIPLKS